MFLFQAAASGNDNERNTPSHTQTFTGMLGMRITRILLQNFFEDNVCAAGHVLVKFAEFRLRLSRWLSQQGTDLICIHAVFDQEPKILHIETVLAVLSYFDYL